MPEPLADGLAEEQASAIRALLRTPLLDTGSDPEAFRLIVRHHAALVEWFEASCGWQLVVDVSAGFARLAKRTGSAIDPSRQLRRPRGRTGAAFDRRRYQLLCLTCAELVRNPVTTIGLLARTVIADAGLEIARRAERSALVDALLVLIDWRVLRNSTGDVEGFVDDQASNAILTGDTTVLHQLLVSAVAPSALAGERAPEADEPHASQTNANQVDPAADVEAVIDRLLSEPRYGIAATDPAAAEEDQRLRWLRHRLARRLLDDPVLHLDELTEAERSYLTHPTGKRWLRERLTAAGMVLEERAEGWIAVDPSATATDLIFPAPSGNAYQFALLLIDKMVTVDAEGRRQLAPLAAYQLRSEVDAVLRRFPGWAATHREGDGPQRLVDAAVELLLGFGLCRRGADGGLIPRPALARYRVGAPTVNARQGELFEMM